MLTPLDSGTSDNIASLTSIQCLPSNDSTGSTLSSSSSFDNSGQAPETLSGDAGNPPKSSRTNVSKDLDTMTEPLKTANKTRVLTSAECLKCWMKRSKKTNRQH